MSAVLLISLGLAVVLVGLLISAALLIRHRQQDVQTARLMRALAQARIRAQVDLTLRAMLRATAEPPARRGDGDPRSREVTRR